jgi:peptidylprolyl isomerase
MALMLGMTRDDIAPLLGRADEQTLLGSLLGEVDTRGQALVVRGEPGIGKTGQQFDASWDRGSTFKFGLGKGQVIAGWDQGVAGMRVGGRRRITIPPMLAYGKRGAGGRSDRTRPSSSSWI